MAETQKTYPYETHLDIRFGPLERIDVQALAAATTHPWWNQTLCRVNGSVVRVGVVQGEYHWHKHDRDDEFFITGRATPVSDPVRYASADRVYRAQGTTHGDEDQLFQLAIERALHSAYLPREGGNTWPPTYSRWRAP